MPSGVWILASVHPSSPEAFRAHLLLYRSGADSSSKGQKHTIWQQYWELNTRIFSWLCFYVTIYLPIASVSQSVWKELHSLDSPSSEPSVKHASSPLLVKGQVQQLKPFARNIKIIYYVMLFRQGSKLIFRSQCLNQIVKVFMLTMSDGHWNGQCNH